MPTEKRIEKLTEVARNRQSGLIVVLENIHDPHNAEAVIRTAEAFGIKDVYFIFEKEESFSPKQIGKKSSSSANRWLDFLRFDSTRECIDKLKADGYTIIATALTGNAQSLFETDLTQEKLAIMVGNEHKGLSEYAVQKADKVITIPMQGMVQSLNLSVTAAIMIFEVFRQRSETGKTYKIAEEKAKEITEKWLKK